MVQTEPQTVTDVVETARGDRVAFDLRGSGPALVFVTGAGPVRAADPWTAETAERAAAQGLTTLVFDRLGRGDSPAEGTLGLDRELDAIAALLGVVGGSAVLCGHSSGCSIALRAAAAGLPVRGLALWEAPLDSSAVEKRAWADRFEAFLDADDAVGAIEQYMKDMPAEWLAGMRAAPDWPASAAVSRTYRADAQSLAWASTALDDGSLATVRVPVVAMYGSQTFPGMAEAARAIAEVVPGAEAREMPGAFHAWAPEPMADLLAAFVRKCSSAG